MNIWKIVTKSLYFQGRANPSRDDSTKKSMGRNTITFGLEDAIVDSSTMAYPDNESLGSNNQENNNNGLPNVVVLPTDNIRNPTVEDK